MYDLSIIYIRPDGSYVINQGMYHVPNEGEWAELWKQVDAYAKEHPEVVMPEPSELEPTFDEVKAAALTSIDNATSAAILAGFEYEVDGEVLHFSYDLFDQQNFADTANACLLAQSGVEGLPQTVTWNGWRNHTKEQKGDLVRLVLDVSSFLNLYTGGALTHKATHMEICGQRKDAIYSSETVEEINNLLKTWQL